MLCSFLRRVLTERWIFRRWSWLCSCPKMYLANILSISKSLDRVDDDPLHLSAPSRLLHAGARSEKSTKYGRNC